MTWPRWPGVRTRWTLAGAGLGLLFVVVATAMDVAMEGLEVTVAAILRLHATEHLLWIIDSAPFVLAGAGFAMGSLQFRLQGGRAYLKRQISKQAQELALELDERRQREAERETVHRIREEIWRMETADHIARVLPLL